MLIKIALRQYNLGLKILALNYVSLHSDFSA